MLIIALSKSIFPFRICRACEEFMRSYLSQVTNLNESVTCLKNSHEFFTDWYDKSIRSNFSHV